MGFPSIGNGLSLEGSSWGVVGLFFSLRETYILNLNTLLSLEPLEKVPGGGGGWWVVVEVLESHFSVQLQPKLNQKKK